MTDAELIALLRAVCTCNIDSTPCMAEDDCRDALAAADRLAALLARAEAAEAALAAERETVARLTEALTLAANRLHRRAVDFDTGSRAFIETSEWAEEARAALAAIKGESHD